MTVLIEGFGPELIGTVLMLSIIPDLDGGNKLLRLNTTYGFLTGIIPALYKFLSPKTLICT